MQSCEWLPLKVFAGLVAMNQAGGETFNACDEAEYAMILHVTQGK